jgi:RNA polymerase sigma-70 factor, ECF subfamily
MKMPRPKADRVPPPPEDDRQRLDDEATAELGRFRPYLQMLARMEFDEALRAKLDASDVVQQTLLEAHQSMGDFRGKSDPEKAAWLRRILTRNLADELRKFRRLKRDVRMEASLQAALNESTARLEKWLAIEDVSPSDDAIANEQLVALATALMQLPEDQRKAVELHHLQSLPSAAIAQRMGRTEIAVAGLLRRGLKRLREIFREDESR